MDEKEQENNFELEQLLLSYTDVCSAVWSTDVSQKVGDQADWFRTNASNLYQGET
jgi:hypothetical protein